MTFLISCTNVIIMANRVSRKNLNQIFIETSTKKKKKKKKERKKRKKEEKKNRSNVKDLMKKAKKDYCVDKIECAAGKCTDMWSTLKTILPSKSKGINVCNSDKTKEKADNYNKHFANICSTHDMSQSTNDCKDMLNFNTT